MKLELCSCYTHRRGGEVRLCCCVVHPQVTKIADAQKLWQELQLKQIGGFKAEVEEEFEDAQGNVYNKRTYLDLKKQGLI
jgi:hypothetical protein